MTTISLCWHGHLHNTTEVHSNTLNLQSNLEIPAFCLCKVHLSVLHMKACWTLIFFCLSLSLHGCVKGFIGYVLRGQSHVFVHPQQRSVHFWASKPVNRIIRKIWINAKPFWAVCQWYEKPVSKPGARKQSVKMLGIKSITWRQKCCLYGALFKPAWLWKHEGDPVPACQ